MNNLAGGGSSASQSAAVSGSEKRQNNTMRSKSGSLPLCRTYGIHEFRAKEKTGAQTCVTTRRFADNIGPLVQDKRPEERHECDGVLPENRTHVSHSPPAKQCMPSRGFTYATLLDEWLCFQAETSTTELVGAARADTCSSLRIIRVVVSVEAGVDVTLCVTETF